MLDEAPAWSIWRHREWCLISTTKTLRLCRISPRTLRIVTLGRSGEAKSRNPSRFDNIGAFSRIRNARQSEGASDSASVSKHQADVCGYGGVIYRANLGGPGGEYCLLEVPICECGMRGSLALHYARLTSSRTKQASLSTAIVLKRGIYEVSS